MAENREVTDACGLCGEPGADKMAHHTDPLGKYWPGEEIPDGDYVHQECEQEEGRRAHAALTPRERNAFLTGI